MSGALAFVLNFDAELELEHGPRYQRPRAMAARVESIAASMRSSLPSGSSVIDPLGQSAPDDATPIAWCPTPLALAAIRSAGLGAPSVPDVAVLTRVNARPFAFALAGEELEGSVLARDLDAAHRALARPGAWLLKRCFGVSGRGQRPVRGGETSAHDTSFIAASLRDHGALVIEPRVVIVRELSVHAWKSAERTHVRSIRQQEVDAHGAFVASALARDLEGATEASLVQTAERVGDALGTAGYVGPFGVDAYEHRGDGTHPLTLRALSEINARYCMGWDERDGWLPP